MSLLKRTHLVAAALAPFLALAPGSPALAQSEPATAPQSEPQSGLDAAQSESPAAAAAASAPPAETVLVAGSLEPEQAYRVETFNAPGPLGAEKLADIPHSVMVVPARLLENVQARSVKEALKYVPLAQFQEQQGSEVLRPATRGMQGSNYQNTRQDGMTIFVTGANPLESLEQIEVLSGLPAAIYGPANPAGMFNFVTKRPTAEPLAELDLGYSSASIFTGHADLGGKVDAAGILSYRLNLVDSRGTSYVSGSDLDRKLASLAVDVHPWSETVLTFNLTSNHLVQKGYPGWFTYGQAIKLPAAPDPTRVGYGQTYAGVDLKNQSLSGRLLQNLGPDWVLVVGALNQGVDRNINAPVNNLTNNSGSYTSSLANGFAPRFAITSDIAYLNGTFRTGAVGHDLTLGTTGFRAVTRAVLNTPTAASVLLGTTTLANPKAFPEPAAGLPDVLHQYDSSVAKQQGINLSDTMALTSQWSVKLAVSQDWMETRNFAKTGLQTTTYNKNGLSPMPSLIFKPRENLTTYVTWASSLQQGDIATSGSNLNTALAPYRSKQIEVGAKAALTGLDATVAVFRLTRPFAHLDTSDNVFKVAGEQLNKGLEATLTGQLSEQLTVFSGVTLLNSTLESTGVAATNGKQYVGIPKIKSNILLEYAMPKAPGVVCSLDWQFTGRRPANDSNSTWAPSTSVVDLGTRYTTRVLGKDSTLRLAVNNVADLHYWSTIGPSNIIGSNTSNMTAHLGAPRTVAASVAVRF